MKQNRKKAYIVRIVICSVILVLELTAAAVFGFTLKSRLASVAGSFPQASATTEDGTTISLPEGFDTSSMPEGFGDGTAPEGFDGSSMPEGGFTRHGSDTDATDTTGTTDATASGNASGSSESGSSRRHGHGSDSTDTTSDGTAAFSMDGSTTFPQAASTGMSLSTLLSNPIAIIILAVAAIVFIVCLVLLITGIVGLVRLKKHGDEEEAAETVPAEEEDPVAVRLRKKRIGRIRLVGVIALLLAVVIVLSVLSSSARQTATSGSSVDEQVLSGTAERGTIARTLTSYGTLASINEEDVTIPGSIRVTEYYVADGDTVKAGDIIATVERSTVLAAIADISELIEKLDGEVADMLDDTISSTYQSPVDGTVVKIYAEAGEAVADVMYDHGSLMLLSIDGLLSLKVANPGTLQVGDAVTVTGQDGTTGTGHVATVEKDTVTITVSLSDFAFAETVTVQDADAAILGSGELEVYSCIKLTGYTGTVSSLLVKEGQSVKSGAKLFKLTDTADTADYQTLLGRRATLVEQYNRLIEISQTGYVYAEKDGVVSGLDEDLLMDTHETATEETTAEEASATEEATASAGGEGALHAIAKLPERILNAIRGIFLDEEEGGNESGGSESTTSKTVVLSWLSQDGSTLTEGLPSELTVVLTANGQEVARKQVSASDNWTVTFTGLDASVTYDVVLSTDREETVPLTGYASQSRSSGNTLTVMLMPSSDSGTGGIDFSGGGRGGWGGFNLSSLMGGTTTVTTVVETYIYDETTLCTLTPNDAVSIDISIDELDVSSIVIGTEVEVMLDAMPGQTFTGTITELDPFGENSGGNTKYTVTVSMDKEPDMLLGMNATVRIDLGETDPVLLISENAIVEQDGKTYVYTAYSEKNDTLSGLTEVILGRADGTNAEVLSGLEEGQTYYYRYAGSITYTFVS